MHQFLKPVPPVHLHLPDIAHHFGSLQDQPLCNDQCHSTPDSVGLNPFQVPVPGDLFPFGRLPVDTDRTVLDDQPDLFRRREILQAHDRVILPDLLDIPLDLFGSRNIPVQPEQSSDIIAHKNRECLGSSSCTPDGPGIIDREIFGPVIVLPDRNLCDPFDRCRDYTLGNQCHRGPDRMIEDLIVVGLPELA